MIKDESIQAVYKNDDFVGFFKKDPKSGKNILYKPVEAGGQDVTDIFKLMEEK